jgi:cyclopropane-fatty-acyl-phospholipid synthase
MITGHLPLFCLSIDPISQDISMNGAKEAQGATAEAIQYHHDVGNDFYRLWLDKSMTYSSALWEAGDTLESAQERKREWHIAAAHAAEASRVLEVGCGWGHLLRRLVEAYGTGYAMGLTLSEAQAEYIASLNNPKLRVRVEGWERHRPAEPYGAIISIGAFEHFARPGLSRAEKVARYRTFFSRCHSWLTPGSRLSLQSIAYAHGLSVDLAPFFASVFPESDLPLLAEIEEASRGLFVIETMRNDPDHYARTLNEWLDRLMSRRDEAVGLVGEDTVEHYQRYLRNSARNFDSGLLMLLRLGLRRVDER